MKAVFMDRDGVINEMVYHESGIIDAPFTVRQFRLLPGVGEAIRLLNSMGCKAIVITNQPAVAKNHLTIHALQEMHDKMEAELREEGAYLDGIYFCPHHPEGKNPDYRKVCRCRKPEPGLLKQAAQDFSLDLTDCCMVGDNLNDIKAGKQAGCKTVFIGNLKCEMCKLMEEQCVKPDFIAPNLPEAVKTILTKWESKV